MTSETSLAPRDGDRAREAPAPGPVLASIRRATSGGRRPHVMSLRCELTHEPVAAGCARQALEAFRGHLHDDLVASSALVATELVANSVEHCLATEGPIELWVMASTERVRVEVTDGGDGFEPPTAWDDPERESGWGLFLVDQLADRWGVDHDDHFRVWAEISQPEIGSP